MSCMRNLSLRPALTHVPSTRIAPVLNVTRWDVTANYHQATVMATTCQMVTSVHVSIEEMGATKCISRWLDAMVCSGNEDCAHAAAVNVLCDMRSGGCANLLDADEP